MVDTLSPAGQRRRVAMRQELEQVLVRRRTRRTAVRAASAVAVLTAAIWWTFAPDPGPRALAPSSTAYEHLDFERVETLTDVQEWFHQDRDLDSFPLVSDDELIDLLAESGNASGILRIGKTVSLTDPVDGDAR